MQRLLLDPTRAYELQTEPDRRRVALVSSLEIAPGQQWVVGGQLDVGVHRGVPVDSGSLSLRSAPLEDEEARDILIEIGERLTDQSLAARDPDGPPPRALVVGDLPGGAEGRSVFQRRLWAHGVRVEAFHEQPARRRSLVRERVMAFDGQILVLVEAGCGTAFGELAALRRGPTSPLLILEETDAADLLIELDLQLDARNVDTTAEVAPVADEGTDWRQAAEEIRGLSSATFVLTRRCRESLETCPYLYPSRMAEYCSKLARLSAKWGERDGQIGQPFVEWAYVEEGLRAALQEPTLVRRRLDRFEHCGVPYSREPHVKVDDVTSFNACGRIYFALDRNPARFVVDHIGLHLYS